MAFEWQGWLARHEDLYNLASAVGMPRVQLDESYAILRPRQRTWTYTAHYR